MNYHYFLPYVNTLRYASPLHDKHFETDKKILIELMNRLFYNIIHQLV